MRLCAAVLCLLVVLAPFPALAKGAKTVHVKGYYRKNGTYVAPHMRSPPSRSGYSTSARTSYRSSSRSEPRTNYSLGAMSPIDANDPTAAISDHVAGSRPIPWSKNSPPTAILVSAQSIPENSPRGSIVGTLSAQDDDAGDKHRFKLLYDADGRFALSGAMLLVEDDSKLDYEAADRHSVIIQASDRAGAQIEKVFEIFVTDVNEPPTDIILSAARVASRAPRRTAVGTLSAVDQDRADKHSFTLTNDGGSNRFVLSDEELAVGNGREIELRKAGSHAVRIKVQDSGGLAFEKELTITVDEREPLPARYRIRFLSGRTKQAADYLEKPSEYLIIGTERSRGAYAKSMVKSIEPLAGRMADRLPQEEDLLPIRQWTDRTGAHRTDARYLGLKDGKVHLLKANGHTALTAFEDLSQDDQVYVMQAVQDEEGK